MPKISNCIGVLVLRIITDGKQVVKCPTFENLSTEFEITLYSTKASKTMLHACEQKLIAHLKKIKKKLPRQVAAIMKVTERTARI